MILGKPPREVKFREGSDNGTDIYHRGCGHFNPFFDFNLSCLNAFRAVAATGCPKNPAAAGFAQITLQYVLGKIKSRTETWDFSAYNHIIAVPCYCTTVGVEVMSSPTTAAQTCYFHN